jgi:two-component system sensor histidine kinase RstB
MTQHIEQLVASQQHLLQAVAHEFRSPVARLRFHLQLIQGADAEKQQRHLAGIDQELDELEAMVNDVLHYLKLGAVTTSTAGESVAVDEVFALLQQLCCVGQDIAVEYTAQPSGACFMTEPRAFNTVYKNLLQNALRHAKSKVIISVTLSAQELRIDVADDGPGIAKENRDKIFEPFARLHESRGRDSGGVGLGLAIVQRLLKSHGGEISVDESSMGGALFMTRWVVG